MALGKIFGQSLRALGKRFLKRFSSTSKRRFLRQSFERRFARFEPLEDRSLMAVTIIPPVSGVLTIQLDATGDAVSIIGNSTVPGGIDVQSATLNQANPPPPYTDVTQIIVQDTGTNTGQSVTFSNSNTNTQFNIANALNVTGIETVNFFNTRTLTAGSVNIGATTGGTIVFGANNADATTVFTGVGTQVYSNPVTLRDDVGLVAGNVSLTNVDLGQFTLTISGPGTITGAITGTGGVTKTGAGTLTYSGTLANSYSGLTTVSSGVLELNKTGNAQAIGGNVAIPGGTLRMLASTQLSSSSNVTVSNNGVLDFNTTNLTESLGNLQILGGTVLGGNSNITIGGTMTQSAGIFNASSNLINVAGDWLRTGGTFLHNNGIVAFNESDVRSGGANFNNVFHGAGRLTLLDAFTTVGAFVNAGGVFDINGITPNINTFVLQGGTVTNSSPTGTGFVRSTNDFDLQAGTVEAVLGGNSGVDKTTAGTVTLTGVNTYSGPTTVSSGTLAIGTNGDVRGSISSDVTVNNPGSLIGDGIVNGDVTGTGTFSPGFSPAAGGPGILTINGNFAPTGIVEFDVNSDYMTAGEDYDQYEVTGTVNLGGAILEFVPGIDTPPPTKDTVITLIRNLGAGAVTASNDPMEGDPIAIGSRLFEITYNGGEGNNDVILEPIVATITVTVDPLSVSEFGSENLIFTFTRDQDTGTLPITFTVTGQATRNVDYTATSPDASLVFSTQSGIGTIVFPDDRLTVRVVVDPIPDSQIEFNEAVTFTVIENPFFIGGDPISATGFITDNTITGVKYNDRDGDGVRDAGEEGIPNTVIYIDLNGDRRLSVLEPFATTDFFGNYILPNLAPGIYNVREIASPGTTGIQTEPGAAAGGGHTVIVPEGPLANRNFGNDTRAANDFGDAPDGTALANGVIARYGTLLASNGARHGILPGFGLGPVDGEPDGQPNATASGDDAAISASQFDDEAGVVISNLTPGAGATLTVTVSTIQNLSGRLQGWIDFDQSGTFEASEKVVSNRSLGAGTHTIPISVPASAKLNTTFARFRFGFEADLGPIGSSTAGEVEDHQVTILPSEPQANDDRYGFPPDPAIQQGAADVVLDVLANDQIGAATFPQIVTADFPGGVMTTSRGGTVRLGPIDNAATGHRNLFYTPPPISTAQAPFTDTFTYRVSRDGTTNTPVDSALVSILVSRGNSIAVDDTFTVDTADSGVTTATLSPLDNDLISGPSRVGMITNITNPAVRVTTATVNATDRTKVDFTAPSGFTGTEVYQYTLTDDDMTTVDAMAFFTVQVVDGGAEATEQALVDAGYLAELDIQIVNTSNQPITSINVGETFRLRVFSDDLRPGGTNVNRGVESAYLDLLTPYFVNADGLKVPYATPVSIEYGPLYDDFNFETLNSPTTGQVAEAGGTHLPGAGGVGPGSVLVFTLTMTANESTIGEPGGVIRFRGDPADGLPGFPERTDINIRFEDDANPQNIVAFHEFHNNPPTRPQVLDAFFGQSDDFRIVGPEGEFVNVDNPLDVDSDSHVTPGDALMVINSLNTLGAISLQGVTGVGKVDCDRDMFLTASDALSVINHINNVPGQAASQQSSTSGTSSSPTTSTEPLSGSTTTTEPVDPMSADELFAIEAARAELRNRFKRR